MTFHGRSLIVALGAVVAIGLAFAPTATDAADQAPRANHVTLITDSVGGVLFWATGPREQMAQDIDLDLAGEDVPEAHHSRMSRLRRRRARERAGDRPPAGTEPGSNRVRQRRLQRPLRRLRRGSRPGHDGAGCRRRRACRLGHPRRGPGHMEGDQRCDSRRLATLAAVDRGRLGGRLRREAVVRRHRAHELRRRSCLRAVPAPVPGQCLRAVVWPAAVLRARSKLPGFRSGERYRRDHLQRGSSCGRGDQAGRAGGVGMLTGRDRAGSRLLARSREGARARPRTGVARPS